MGLARLLQRSLSVKGIELLVRRDQLMGRLPATQLVADGAGQPAVHEQLRMLLEFKLLQAELVPSVFREAAPQRAFKRVEGRRPLTFAQRHASSASAWITDRHLGVATTPASRRMPEKCTA